MGSIKISEHKLFEIHGFSLKRHYCVVVFSGCGAVGCVKTKLVGYLVGKLAGISKPEPNGGSGIHNGLKLTNDPDSKSKLCISYSTARVYSAFRLKLDIPERCIRELLYWSAGAEGAVGLERVK